MLELKKFISARFGDPITALDLSKKFVCHGSAMGRIAFYNLETDSESVLAETSPELIRGISHTASGEDIWISVGDISCQKLNAYDLTTTDNLMLIEDDGPNHKPVCERAFTMLHGSNNCVLTFDLPGMLTPPHAPPIAPIAIFDLR